MAAASAPEATSLATPAAVIKCMEAAQRGRELNDVAPLAPEGLVPALYPYQSAAVRWMMDRERGVDGAAVAARAARLFGRDDAGAALDGDGLRGGLLCDEMGLGKTVAVVALRAGDAPPRRTASTTSARPARACACASRGDDGTTSRRAAGACGPGAAGARRLAAAASPAATSSTATRWPASGAPAGARARGAPWSAPSARRAAALRDCLRRADGSAFAEDADVVVATFSALQRDAHYVSRGATPLVAVDWFRCVVDEAQHVQGGASAAAAVARAVRATRRWGAKAEEAQRRVLFHLLARAGVARCRADLAADARGYAGDAPGLVADARAAVGRGAGAAPARGAVGLVARRAAARRRVGRLRGRAQRASANCFGSPASRPGFEFRCGAAGPARVEAAVDAALRRAATRDAALAALEGLAFAGDGAFERETALAGDCGACAADWGASGPRCPNCARVDAIDACRAQLKSRRGGAERSGVEVNAPATRALCALARFGERAATATLDALGCGANGESRLAANRDAGIKHEMLLASRAASQAIFALLRENEALSAARRLTVLPAARLYDDLGDDAVAHLVPGDFAAKDMEAELEGAAAATELAALEKTLAFLESHARRRRRAPALDGACVYGDGACVAVLPCGHGFHGACLDRVRRSRCPSCNANFSASDVRRAVAATSPEPASGAPGAHGTKLDAFLRDAKAAAARGDQSVVFSNLEEVLDFVARALADAELAVARFTPAGVADFTAPRSSIPFLLAPVGRANNGLTLVNATNVFLLEPPTSHAVELQCVNRVHRVGQRRPTTVFRYVVGATVEAAIHGGHEALRAKRRASDEGEDVVVSKATAAFDDAGVQGSSTTSPRSGRVALSGLEADSEASRAP
ncbi:ATP binding protein [Aureococcus anophagefferens]|nr:ATP binding protein [Aureococcus anophagefferens]